MKTIVITGVTGAVGQAAVRALADKGNMKLILVARNRKKLEAVAAAMPASRNNVTQLVTADISDLQSLKSASAEILRTNERLDALINIAAVYKATKTNTPQGLETMFATNHLATYYFTRTLLPLLRKSHGSKILNVAAPSSTRIDFENINGEKKFSALNAFGASKMMNLLTTFSISKELRNDPHAIMAFHPGLVKSDLLSESPAFVRGLFRIISSPPDKAGKAIATLILSEDVSLQNGKFYNSRGKEMKAAAHAYDPKIQQQLITLSDHILATV